MQRIRHPSFKAEQITALQQRNSLMIQYSQNAKKSLAYLLQPYNDIDVFVEDTTCMNMYIHYINRIISGRGKITHVHRLGGKKDVLAACANDQRGNGRPRLYVIDGDLEALTNIPIEEHKDLYKNNTKRDELYRLRTYCFENILFNEDSLIEIASESKHNSTVFEITQLIKYPQIESEIKNKFSSIFLLYGIATRLNLRIQTVKYNMHRLCIPRIRGGNRQFIICPHKVRDKTRDLISKIVNAVGWKRYIKEKRFIKKQITRKKLTSFDYISGKSYIMPIIHNVMDVKCDYRGDDNQLKAALAKTAPINREKAFSKRIRKLLRDTKAFKPT
ncbi:DUF4435 domain-containing protein [Pseudomonadota bacterium]